MNFLIMKSTDLGHIFNVSHLRKSTSEKVSVALRIGIGQLTSSQAMLQLTQRSNTRQPIPAKYLTE